MNGVAEGHTYSTNDNTYDWESAGMTLNNGHLSGIREEFVFDISQLPGEMLIDSYQLYTIYNEAARTYLCKTNGLSATSTYSPDTCKWAIFNWGFIQIFYNNPWRYLNWDSGKWCAIQRDTDDLYFWKVSGQISYSTTLD